MLNRWSVLLLVLGVMAGYAIAGQSVTAQGSASSASQILPNESEPLPFFVGDTITLRYQRLPQDNVERSLECTVMNIRGIYVRCAPGNFDQNRDVENWHSTKSVVQILRRPK